MAVTLRDIAEELNLSVNAVSRALRNMPDISAETTRQIHETAQRMGYRKNLAASYLKTARSMTLGIIIPDISNPVFSSMYKGIERVSGKLGYTLMLSNSGEKPQRETAQLDSMIAHGVDGVFIVPSIQSSTFYNQLEAAKIPYVILQRKVNEKQSNFVQSDDFEGGYLAAKHLCELGHRDFLLIFPNDSISSAKERYNGFVSYLNEANIPEASVSKIECESTRDASYQLMREWLEEQPNHKSLSASAVFCFSDYVACGVYSAIAEYGLSIPEDLSVIGYDNNEYSDMLYPPLTTVDILSYDIGKHAARLMLDTLQNEASREEDNSTKVLISPKIIVRASTRRI